MNTKTAPRIGHAPTELTDQLTLLPLATRRTKLIDDQKLAQPRYRGLVHGTLSIVKEEGIGGVYRGLGPVVSTCYLGKRTGPGRADETVLGRRRGKVLTRQSGSRRTVLSR